MTDDPEFTIPNFTNVARKLDKDSSFTIDIAKGDKLLVKTSLHKFIVEIPVSPHLQQFQNDRFILQRQGQSPIYKTIQDDIRQDDRKITLEFHDIHLEKKYSLIWDSGDGELVYFFHEKSGKELEQFLEIDDLFASFNLANSVPFLQRKTSPTSSTDKPQGQEKKQVDYKNLPTIDVHCHMVALSIALGEGLPALSEAETIVSEAGTIVIVQKNKDGKLVVIDRLKPPIRFYTGKRPFKREYREVGINSYKNIYVRGVIEIPENISLSIEKLKEFDAEYENSDQNKIILKFPQGSSIRSPGLLGGELAIPLVIASCFEKPKHFLASDIENANQILKSIPDQIQINIRETPGTTTCYLSQRRNVPCIAAVPLVLDLEFTPLDLPYDIIGDIIEYGLSYMLKSSHRRSDYYSNQEKYFWFSDKSLEYILESQAQAARQFPGQIWPFVPFDPRRPDDNGILLVKTFIQEKGFVGVKLYSRCGWMPYQNDKMYGSLLGTKLDSRLDSLYKYASENDLPITVHTSPTGYPPNSVLVLPKTYAEKTIDFAPPLKDSFHSSSLEKVAQIGCWEAANYCHYIQHTVSPYAWIPVLAKFNDLRLNFAHFGSEISLLARLAGKTTDSKLIKSPMVASGADFKNILFLKFAIQRILESLVDNNVYMDTILFSSHYFAIHDFIIKELKQDIWQNWLTRWEEKYPLDWWTKIVELQKKYPNVYCDIAYISASTEQLGATLEKLVELSKTETILRDRLMVGTDWYMTELDKISAQDFWRAVQKVLAGTDICSLWTCGNALDFLNLSPRFSSMEAWYSRAPDKNKLPEWWQDLKEYYE